MVPAGDDAQAVVGTTIAGKYFVHELLGRGGMGVVYKATWLGPDRPVALKLLAAPGLRADPSLARRFEREAAAASRLHHPNAVEVHDFGAGDDGALYLAMEFVPGRTLAQVVAQEAPLPAAAAAHLAGQVLGALADAHAKGIVHRDLKPANVMVDPLRDPAGFVKVVDFGLATVAGPEGGEERLTGRDVVFGTPAYMSPEQIRGEPLDARSDLYSVGVMLFELLSGTLPFDAPTQLALAAKHLGERAPRLRERRPELAVPAALEELVARALEKDPARRPSTADVMRAELAAAVAGRPAPPPRELPPTVPMAPLAGAPTAGPPVARRSAARLGIAAGVAAGVVVAILALAAGRDGAAAPAPAVASATGSPGTGIPTATATATATPTPTPIPIPTPTATATATYGGSRRRAREAIRLVRGELGAIPTPPVESGDGVLVLVATPWAEVDVAGKGLGETPREVRVAAGTYAVRAVHPELGARGARIEVKPGERRLWTARFEP